MRIWCRPSESVISVSGGAVPTGVPSTSTWPHGLTASRMRPEAAGADALARASRSRAFRAFLSPGVPGAAGPPGGGDRLHRFVVLAQLFEPMAQLARQGARRAEAMLRVLFHRARGDLGERLGHVLVDELRVRRLVLQHGLRDLGERVAA